jgi:hypothetical protein
MSIGNQPSRIGLARIQTALEPCKTASKRERGKHDDELRIVFRDSRELPGTARVELTNLCRNGAKYKCFQGSAGTRCHWK